MDKSTRRLKADQGDILFTEELKHLRIIADELGVCLNGRELQSECGDCQPGSRCARVWKERTVGKYAYRTSDPIVPSPIANVAILTGGLGIPKYAFMIYGW